MTEQLAHKTLRNSVERKGPCVGVNDGVRTEMLMSQDQTVEIQLSDN